MKKERKNLLECLMVNNMRRILNKIKKGFRLLGAIIYLIHCRIKYRKKKRGIAQVVDSFNSGGLEQVAANIYKTFKKEGNTSAVISITNNVGPMCQQLDSPKDLRIVYYDIAEMIKYCAKNNIGTLIYHFTTFHMILFRLLGFKNYYIIHNTYIWYTKKEWKNLKTKLKYTSGIIAVSEWCKNYFVQKTGINNIKVILNGINFENLNNGEKTSITRKSLKIKDNEIVCLTIGGYTDGKHQMAIIGIAEEVIKVNKNIKFICAGPILNEKLYKSFVKNVKKSSAKNNIIALTYIPQEEIGDFLTQNCDIYLQPSIHEAGVPLTVMEALLKGKPVIMTDFMLDKTFPNRERIIGVTPPYDNILEITPEVANKMSKRIKDKSTNEFVEKVCLVAKDLKKYQSNFNSKEYDFLSTNRMAKEYIDYIKL